MSWKAMKRLLTLLFAYACAIGMANAINPRIMQLLREDSSRIGVIKHSYEFAVIQDEAAPGGYQPFYISHYGRHGSRSDWDYPRQKAIYEMLTRADSLGKLTENGRELLQITQEVMRREMGVNGRLTDRGEREHTRLAERMYKRFPKVFRGKQPNVNVVGSMVPRCLVSMAAFTNGLTRCNPRVEYDFDTGEHYQTYMFFTSIQPSEDDAKKAQVQEVKRRIQTVHDSLMRSYRYDTAMCAQRLFTDTVGVKVGSVARLQRSIYDMAAIAQDLEVPCNVFRYVDSMAVYAYIMDVTLYVTMNYGNVEGFAGDLRWVADRTVKEIIANADRAIQGGENAPVADLRFGHDNSLLNLVSRLNISGVGSRMKVEEVEQKWVGSENLPMASNLQLIFYRKSRGGDVLVKVLYNERERKVDGLQPVQGCYYRWQDLRAFWEQ